MYFYHSMFDLCHGQCAIWLKAQVLFRRLDLPLPAKAPSAAPSWCVGGCPTPQATAAGCSWVWVRFGLGIALLLLLRFRLVNCFACLLAALAWLAALVPFPVWVLRLNRIPRLLSVWCIASRGHHFALGTGGLKLSLLVGGLGPVYSLPKHCFKPFRSFEGNLSPLEILSIFWRGLRKIRDTFRRTTFRALSVSCCGS